MDGTVASNPQHYQPLSHALNHALTARPHSPYTSYSADPRDGVATTSARIGNVREEEEEEEEEEEVEGAVNAHAHSHSGGTLQVGGSDDQPSSPSHDQDNSVVGRRRPGRPKGSKNKKPRFDMSTPVPGPATAKPSFSPQPFFGFPQAPPPGAVPMQPPPPPPPPPSVIVPSIAGDPNTQQFFDFQWRVLTLCSEFYNAADELIRGAPPHVVSQCYSLPGNHVDPLNVLHEARRACDQLMANPSQNILKVPPVTFNSEPQVKSGTTTTTTTSPPTGVITNPGSFVMSLSSSAPSSTGFNSISPPRYPTTSYYAYATTAATSSTTLPYLQQQQVIKPVNLTTPAAAGNQGAWSDEETDKLKKLAEESRGQSNPESREIDWDWVCNNWGPSRTRHQILIKATNIGLKESSTRGVKKKRDSEPASAADGHPANSISPQQSAPPPTASPSTAPPPSGSSVGLPDRPASTSMSAHQSPAITHAATHHSPAMTHAATMSTPTPGTAAMMGNWPMPHVAANTPSPVISSNAQPSVGRTPYYRTTDRQGGK